MKIKRFIAVTCALMLIIVGSCFVLPNNVASAYYKDTSYFETSGDYTYHNESISYDTKELYDIHLNRLSPNYRNHTQANSCAPMAGVIVLGYHDYVCTNLIPDFTPGLFYNGTFYYNAQTTQITTIKEQLYDLMGTNTVAPGTSVSQFKSGLSSYVFSKGYSIAYTTCGADSLTNNIISCLNEQLPVVLFLSSYDYYDSVSISDKNGQLSLYGKISTTGHVMVAYGYRQYKFYTNGTLTRTEDYLVVIFGDGSQGYLALNSLTKIDTAIGINIF